MGGHTNIRDMLMSVGSLYIEPEGVFKSYKEDQIQEMIDEILSADLVVGFNVINFDYVVLSHYTDKDFSAVNTVDMLFDVQDTLGHRLKLDTIAKASLDGVKKSADGLAALRWFKEGKIDEIIKYCEQDVAVTRDVYKHGLNEGAINYFERNGFTKRTAKITWKERVHW